MYVLILETGGDVIFPFLVLFSPFFFFPFPPTLPLFSSLLSCLLPSLPIQQLFWFYLFPNLCLEQKCLNALFCFQDFILSFGCVLVSFCLAFQYMGQSVDSLVIFFFNYFCVPQKVYVLIGHKLCEDRELLCLLLYLQCQE